MQRPLKPADKTILKMLKDLMTLWTTKKCALLGTIGSSSQ